MSEEYSVGYSEGYQAGWNAAMDATPPAAPVQDIEHCVWARNGNAPCPHTAAQTRPATREEKIVRPGVYEVPEFNCPRCGHCCSQRQWVGLTDDEFLYCVELKNPVAIAEEVEAKLKEKNT